MWKFLILLGAVLGLVWLVLGRRRSAGSHHAAARKPEPMVSCAQCGVHLPRSDALAEGDQHYCGPAHQRLGPRKPS